MTHNEVVTAHLLPTHHVMTDRRLSSRKSCDWVFLFCISICLAFNKLVSIQCSDFTEGCIRRIVKVRMEIAKIIELKILSQNPDKTETQNFCFQKIQFQFPSHLLASLLKNYCTEFRISIGVDHSRQFVAPLVIFCCTK